MAKKRKETSPKEKQFRSASFGSLKGFQPEGAARVEKRPAPPPAERRQEDMPDADLFLREMTGVRPLEKEEAAAALPKKIAAAVRKVDEEERRVFLKALDTLELDVRFRDELPDDVQPLRPVSTSRMRQLKRGEIRVDLELDLHGLTRDEALQSLHRFISGAYMRGQKAVLVITGKGNNSPDEPVLIRAVAGWLQDKGREMVAEFTPAPREMGGSGAFIVFLRGGR
jgi:DNA-nicking Smr family endonuclease